MSGDFFMREFFVFMRVIGRFMRGFRNPMRVICRAMRGFSAFMRMPANITENLVISTPGQGTVPDRFILKPALQKTVFTKNSKFHLT